MVILGEIDMRKVYCIRCGKAISEGEKAVRRKHFTGFYCSFECLVLETGIAEIKTVSEDLVNEDKEASGYGWDEE